MRRGMHNQTFYLGVLSNFQWMLFTKRSTMVIIAVALAVSIPIATMKALSLSLSSLSSLSSFFHPPIFAKSGQRFCDTHTHTHTLFPIPCTQTHPFPSLSHTHTHTLSPSLSLSLSHTHTHRHTHKQTVMREDTHPCARRRRTGQQRDAHTQIRNP